MFLRSECNWVRDNLSPYIDEQLALEERRRVEAHLAQCVDCQEELASLRATVGLLGRVPEAVPLRSFALAAPEPRRRAPAFAFFRLATALAALLLVVVLSGDVLQGLGYLPSSSAPAQMTTSQADQSLKSPPAEIPGASPGEQQPGPSAAEGPEERGKGIEGPGLPKKPTAPLTTTTVPETFQEPTAVVAESAPQEVIDLLPWRVIEMGLTFLVVVLGGATVWLARRS